MRFVLALLSLGVLGCAGGGEFQDATTSDVPRAVTQEVLDEAQALSAVLEGLQDAGPAEVQRFKVSYTTLVQMTLGQLGFGAGPFTGVNDAVTQAAVRRYEEARGLPTSGDPMSPLTLATVLGDAKRIESLATTPQASVYAFIDGGWDNGIFMANGTWFAEGQRLAHHITAMVLCVRADGECTLDYARMSRSSQILDASRETYSIASWDAAEISSAPRDTQCVRYVLRINRVAESVRLTRSALSQEGPCEVLDAEELVMYLPTWEQAYWERQSEQNDIYETLYLLSAEARAALVQREDDSR